MAESLAQHVLALGLTVAGEDVTEDVVLVDAATHIDSLGSRLAVTGTSTKALIIIANEADMPADRRRIEGAQIVSKPVQRHVLRAALSSALGMCAATVRTAALAAMYRPPSGHVLLVEDEAVNAAVAQGYLEELGCTSVWVKEGQEAVARSAAERFDLILMDLSMPKMDGFATTALIRQRGGAGPRVPIIALSAHDAVAYRDTCLSAGMDDILSKPYTLEQCAQLLRRWMARNAQSTLPAQSSLENLSTVDTKTVSTLRKLRATGGAEFYSQLVDLFRKTSSEGLAQLRTAVENDDFKTAGAVCHKLTSSAANVGALAFAKHVRELGRLCSSGDRAAARDLHAYLQSAYPALIDELHNIRLRAIA